MGGNGTERFHTVYRRRRLFFNACSSSTAFRIDRGGVTEYFPSIALLPTPYVLLDLKAFVFREQF